MTRQHDRGDGTFGECKARNVANCPYTKRGLSHFDSVEEANEFLEKQALTDSGGQGKLGKYVRPVVDDSGDFQPESLYKRLTRWEESGELRHTSYSIHGDTIDVTVRDDPYDTVLDGLTYASEAQDYFKTLPRQQQVRHCKKLVTKAMKVGLIQLPEGKKIRVTTSKPMPLSARYILSVDGASDEEIYEDRLLVKRSSPYDKRVYDAVIDGEEYSTAWKPVRRGYVEALSTAEELIESQYEISIASEKHFMRPSVDAHEEHLAKHLGSKTSEGYYVDARVDFDQLYSRP